MLRWILSSCLLILLQILYATCSNSSLTFVIDDTGSMGDEISYVKRAAGDILNIVLREKGSEIEDVVLVTFNDIDIAHPDPVMLRAKTQKKQEFLDALNDISVYGGDDCAEYALSGIELALKESKPGSYLFVFTDASAKDYKKAKEIISLCEKKQSQVIFILTGYCYNLYAGFKVFYDIAKASSGQVFYVSKYEVKSVVDIIKETVRDKKSVITWVTVPPSYTWKPIPFTVDDKTEYVIISTSGENVGLRVSNNKLSALHEMSTKKLLWKYSGKVVRFDAPSPGTYYVWTKGQSDVSIVVYARTDFTFDHGFSEFVPKSLADASKLPIADRNHYLSISVTDPEHTVDIKTAEIIDMDGNVITQLPLKKTDGDFYITDSFYTPSTMFKIQVTGVVKRTGKEIKRISKTAIEPQTPPRPDSKAPEITISEGTSLKVDYDGSALLTCKVSGYPEPKITWTTDNTKNILSKKSNVVEPPYEYISYLKLSNIRNPGTYYCRAENELATEFSKIHVTPRSPFKVDNSLPGITSAKFGEETKLICGITSSYPYDIKWYTHLNPSEYTLSADKKVLTIKQVNIAAQGSYSCEATLKSDHRQKETIATSVVISDLALPTIDQNTPSTITASYGNKIIINCKITGGVPRPTINWQFMSHDNNVFQDLAAAGEQIIVDKASFANAGQYRCLAVNAKGHNSKTIKVIVEQAPIIVILDGSKQTIAYGDSTKLTCKIIALPLPTIGWKDSNGREISSENSIVDNEITSRVTLANVKTNGTYSCFASNTLGRNVGIIDILVKSPFVVKSHPEDTLHSKYGVETAVVCDIKSSFPMRIRWFKRDSSKISEIHNSDNYMISSTGTTLRILSTTLSTVGKYTCEASLVDDNRLKLDFTTNIQINDLSAPVLQDPVSTTMTVQDKDKVEITCKIASGNPPPVVNWQVLSKGARNFADLSVSGHILIIDSATLRDAGQYKCIARNIKGEAEKTTELIVQKAPEATIDEGTAVTVPYGDNTELKCRIVAYPLPHIVWKDTKGHVLKSQDTINGYQVTSIIRVQNIKSSDTYSCYAKNGLGETVTSTQISVLPSIIFPTNLPATRSVNYGDPTTIHCVPKSSFPMKIKWFYQKNDQNEKSEIHTSDKYRIHPKDHTLDIISTDLDLVGKYTCEASLISDDDEKKSFTTKVEINNIKAPEITYMNDTVTIMNRQYLLLACDAIGVPKPVTTWDVKPVNSDEFVKISNQGSVLTNAVMSYEWAGLYRCTAANKVGSVSSTTQVIVHGPPNITNAESTYVGTTGDKVLKIPCEVTGVPDPVISWKQGNKMITSDAKITVKKNEIFINNPTEKDSSKFTCEAKNKYGFATKTFEAIVSDFISWNEDQNSVFYLKPGESADITCLIEHLDPQSVRWYVNGEKTSTIGTIYKIRNAKFENDGNYTCRVNTDQGSDSLNFVVDVGYKPTFKLMLPSTITWNGNSDESLDCNVNAKPGGDIKWFYNGKELKENLMELPIVGWGTYSCEVSNVHGNVQHTYNVTSDGCVVNTTTVGIKNTPLLIGEEASVWPNFDREESFLIINKNQKITLACSTQDQPTNTFKTHKTAEIIHAECLNENNFIVDGVTFKFEDLQCKELVRASQVLTKKTCMKTGEIIEIGFRLNNGFLGVYDVCYNEVNHKTMFAKVDMIVANFGNKVDSSFKLNDGTKTAHSNNGVIIKCRYNQQLLVNPADVAFGPAQTATLMFNKFNTIPIYEPCDGSSRISWSEVENIVRSSLYSMSSLTVWTGASKYDSRGRPRYLWKVAKFEDDTFEVIVYVNAPDPGSSDILCRGTAPDKFSDILDANDQYTYYCSLDDFTKAFGLSKSDFSTTS